MSENNPLKWLPKAGQQCEIPGGVLWCERWSVDIVREHDKVTPWGHSAPGRARTFEGEIIFRFHCDADAYGKAVAEAPQLAAAPAPVITPHEAESFVPEETDYNETCLLLDGPGVITKINWRDKELWVQVTGEREERYIPWAKFRRYGKPGETRRSIIVELP